MIFIITKFGGIYCVRYILYLLETLIQHLWYSVRIKVETAKKKTTKNQIIKNYKKKNKKQKYNSTCLVSTAYIN